VAALADFGEHRAHPGVKLAPMRKVGRFSISEPGCSFAAMLIGQRRQLLDALRRLERQRAAMTDLIIEMRARLAADEVAPVLLTVKQAAHVSGFDIETVRRWAAQGLVGARRIGGRWAIDAVSLMRFVEAHTV
jgi:hypothetical protein